MGMNRRFRGTAYAAFACAISATQLSCGSTAYEFVHDKTGIEVGHDVRLCSNGVLHDDPRCRPDGTGGLPWAKNENFDIFSLPMSSGGSDWHEPVASASMRYLGAPYWNGHLQTDCKAGLGGESLPAAANPAVDLIDLAAKLDDEISKNFEVKAVANLREAGIPIDFEAQARFHDSLARIVRQKIRVKLLWFVSTYTGGRYAIEANQNLARCRQEVQAHAGEGARFVTGVAGFIVLQNEADVTINSASTLAAALSVVVDDPSRVINSKLESSWEDTVANVVKVNASTRSLTQTVYPLWIQFE
jgi:hypothetical protein